MLESFIRFQKECSDSMLAEIEKELVINLTNEIVLCCQHIPLDMIASFLSIF